MDTCQLNQKRIIVYKHIGMNVDVSVESPVGVWMYGHPTWQCLKFPLKDSITACAHADHGIMQVHHVERG